MIKAGDVVQWCMGTWVRSPGPQWNDDREKVCVMCVFFRGRYIWDSKSLSFKVNGDHLKLFKISRDTTLTYFGLGKQILSGNTKNKKQQ
jgi:hypothetical protein